MFAIPELVMNPISKHLIEFIFKNNDHKTDEYSDEKGSKGLDFEAFVDMMSVFHKNTSVDIKLKCRYLQR